MIVACCSAGRSDAAVGELESLGRRFDLGGGRLVASGSITLMAWQQCGAAVDESRATAWMGRLDSPPGDLVVEDAGRHDGSYALLARDGGGLLAARSLFGGRPLYYGVSTTRNVYACSRLAPLLHLLGGGRSIDVDRLAAHVILRDAADPRATVWRGIRRVLPGESIRFEIDGTSQSRRTSFCAPTLPKMSTEDWADSLRAEIEAAVARSTEGCRRPAVLASGGLDSSAVFSALVCPRTRTSHVPPTDVLALTYDFDAPCSDRPYFAALVASTPVEAVRVTPDACAHNALASMVLDGAPRPWPTTAMNIEILGRARAMGADRVLTGMGGDFFWDLEIDSIGERAVAGDIVAAVREAVDLKAVYWMPTRRDRLRGLVVRPFLRSLVPARVHGLRLRRALRAFDYPDWAGPALLTFMRGHVERCLESSERVHDRASRMTELASSATLADVVDGIAQVETYVGAEESHVFFDVRLARFLSAIPSHIVLAGGWLRGVLRMAFRDVWPRSIVERTDKGDFEPAMATSTEGLRTTGVLEGLAEMRALGDLGIVEPAKFRAAFATMLAGPGEGGDLTAAWPLLVLEAFASGVAAHESLEGARGGAS